MRPRLRIWEMLAVLVLVGFTIRAVVTAKDQPAPVVDPLPLKFVSVLPPGAASECSGIVRSRSRSRPDLFWVHNDSGDEPRIYAVRRDGSGVPTAGAGGKPGVLVEGARHVDWEDIAACDDGSLLIADLGNNGNARRDLTIYRITEPVPGATSTAVQKQFLVRYPDQLEFPAPRGQFNFDCEALFTIGDVIHVLTKHRSDSKTTLYRLDDPRDGQMNVLTRVGERDLGGMVVAADCSADGRRLAVLTYKAIWLFERDDLATPFFEGRVRTRSFVLPQAEGLCFADDNTLLLTDEITDSLFEVAIAELGDPKP